VKGETASRLMLWWQGARRGFPWRERRDPYSVLIAEVLLHRTRAEQVVPVYTEFLRRYPDIPALAAALPGEVVEILRPLGLRWRALLLHRMAQAIAERTGGEILPDRDWLTSLPGVGDYIASAVRCFAFNLPEPVLDTNTVRITGRFFGVRITDASRRSRRFRELFLLLMNGSNPREFNLAMIDLGALVCRPVSPVCGQCPLAEECFWHRERRYRDG
jgi:A/G-specific adenine glycosylase